MDFRVIRRDELALQPVPEPAPEVCGGGPRGKGGGTGGAAEYFRLGRYYALLRTSDSSDEDDL